MKRDILRTSRTLAAALGLALASQTLSMPAFAVDVKQSTTYLEQAKKFLARGDERAARIELLNSLKANPNNVDARLLLAQLYLDNNSGLAAQTEIEAARDAGAGLDATRVMMGNAYLLQGQFDKALDELDLNTIPATDTAEAYRLRGRALGGKGQLEEAEAALREAEELNPSSPAVKVDLARSFFRMGKVEEAKEKIDAALELDPSFVDALLFKGESVRLTEGHEAALPYFERAVEADPNNFTALLERAASFIDLGREEQAQRDIDAVYKQVPEHPLAHYLSAVLRARQKDYEGARELMNRTRGALDNYIPALQFQGLVSYELGDLEQATTYLSRVLRVLPGSGAARRVYGAALLRKGQPRQAIEALQPLIDAGVTDSPLLALMGMAYGRAGDYEQALTYFENAVAKAPDQTALRTQLAVSRLAVGNPEAATRDLQDILDVEPDSANALIMLTLIDMREKRYDDALQSAQRLVEAQPERPLGHNMVGAAQLGLGNLKEARTNFEKAIEIDSEYKEARRNLAQLDIAEENYDDARRHYLRILEVDRDDVKTLQALAQLADRQEKPEEALTWLQRASDANPTLIQPRIQLIDKLLQTGEKGRALNDAVALANDFPRQPAALEVLGRVQIANENKDAAVNAFRDLVKLVPDQMLAYRLLASAYLENDDQDGARSTLRQALDVDGDKADVLSALIRLEAGANNYGQALRYAERMRAEYPDRTLGQVAMGDIYMGMEDFPRAVTAYEAAIKQERNQANVMKLQAAHSARGDRAKAEAVMRDWIKDNPEDNVVHLTLATHLLQSGDLKRAAAEHERLLEKVGDNGAVLNNLAWIYQQLDDKRMVEVAERAYAKNPDSPQIGDTLGWILVSEDVDVKRGLLLLQQASQQLPEDGDIRYHLAYALERNGRKDAAVRELQALLDQNFAFSSRSDALALLDRLQGGN